MVIRVPELPHPGETVAGGEFEVFGGGKGANQAIAARRAGGDVQFIAAVGNDEFGKSAIATFAAEGIDISGVHVIDDAPSGVAMIFVNHAGENCIGVAPGANARLTPELLSGPQDAFGKADVLLLQLETPLETVAAAVEIAAANNLPVVLNPAPATQLSDQILKNVYCLTPNSNEAEAMTGVAISDEKSAVVAAEVLLGRGVQNVVITLGGHGALPTSGALRRGATGRLLSITKTSSPG